jgi:hypothetical protein
VVDDVEVGVELASEPSIVISALNISVRSGGRTIECRRMIAANSRTSAPMRISLSGTPS